MQWKIRVHYLLLCVENGRGLEGPVHVTECRQHLGGGQIGNKTSALIRTQGSEENN